MTVLQLISSAGFYGAESMLVSLSHALGRLGCDVTAGVLSDQRHPHEEVAEAAQELGLKTCVIPCQGRFDTHVPGRIRKLLKNQNVDILHTHGYKADLYGFAAARLAPVGHRSRLVSTCHNWPNPSARMQSYAKLNRVFLRFFDAITTPSPLVEKILKDSGIAPRKVFWISNGVNVGVQNNAQVRLAVRRELNVDDDAPVVGFVGRMVDGKGGTTLLEAAKQIVNAVPSVKFVFIGEGPQRKDWEGLVQVLGLSGRVFFTGVRKDMSSMYAAMDIMVLPSYEEAMPMCVLEAMAAGLPVVATRVGAIPEVVDQQSGIVVEPRDAMTLAEAMLRLLQNPEAARAMGEAGRKRIQQKYSSDAMAQQYMNIYSQAVAGKLYGQAHGTNMRAA